MTREEAIGYFKDMNECTYGNVEPIQMAIKALEQENVLEKIKAEIEQSYCTVNNDYDHGRNYGLYTATQIIDKYKTEMESEE